MVVPPVMSEPDRAWAPFEPDAGRRWDLARVAHLHRRAGFAAPWAILRRDLRDGPEASVVRLLDGEPTGSDGRPADETEGLFDRMAARLAPEAGLTRLQGIWLYRMVFTPHPLRERMTLFWHNHFATSHAKVQNSALMQRQNDLLRAHALGRFEPLLAAIARDPAMLVYLDAESNRKGHPNENFAREVMELFTLGRGQYTEDDIREAARAFTGRSVVRDRFQEVRAQHDAGPKAVLGRSGPLSGDDIPPILVAQPSCAGFLCGKLVRHFVTEVDPVPPALIDPLARAYRESGYDVRVPIGIILRSNLFHDPGVRRHRVKGPVELVVGTLRALEVLRPTVPAETLASACERMGQALFAPPSVAGWEGGPSWINSATLLHRANFALTLLADPDRGDVSALAARHGAAGREGAGFLADLLVQDASDREFRERTAAKAATLILTAPEYQLA